MTRGGRFKMAAMFALLSTVYIYGASTGHGWMNVWPQLWGACGFIGLAVYHGAKAFWTK